MTPFSKILVPIDFTVQSIQAVRRAVEVAGVSDAEIVLLHFYDPTESALPSESIAYTRAQLERMGEPLLQRLEAARRDTEALGARRVTSRLEYGDPATGIVGIAADEGVDLIVMGTHGRTGVSRWLIGSVAEKVVRSAPCAVLTVKAPVPRTATSRTSRTDSAEPAGH